MKHFLLISLLMLFSLPVFAVPGESVFDEYGNEICDNSDMQEYAKLLEQQFFKKYPNGNFSGNDYNREVQIPIFDFLTEKQNKGHCGFEEL